MSLQLFGWTPSADTAAREGFGIHGRNTGATDYWVASANDSLLSPNFSSYEEDPDADDYRPRKGDPNWVARPRNAFIIFRCEYSKQNARGTCTIGGKRGSHSVDRTMSKRAGDAWKLLSKSQKNHYKQLADQEKKEHALAHPGYRYRPKKKGSSSSPRRHLRGAYRSTHSADSRLESSYPPSDDDDDRNRPAVPSQISLPMAEPIPRFLKRRSISAPLLPPLLLTPQQRLEIRRTQSGILTAPSSPPLSPGSSLSNINLVYPKYPEHDSALGYESPGSVTPASEPNFSVPTFTTPPLAAVYSSLADWNGFVAPPMDPVASKSSSSSPTWVTTPPSEVNYQMYNPEGYASTITPYWNPGLGVDNANLHSYNVGLADHSTPDDYLRFDTPLAEEQRIFEGFCHF